MKRGIEYRVKEFEYESVDHFMGSECMSPSPLAVGHLAAGIETSVNAYIGPMNDGRTEIALLVPNRIIGACTYGDITRRLLGRS